MPYATDSTTQIECANRMSDHNVQADAILSVVSQNLQGPYAIKTRRSGVQNPLYAFDLPQYTDGNTPERLAELTGMSKLDCEAFIRANQNCDSTTLESILMKYEIGDLLGQSGFRRALETNDAYRARMERQIFFLKNIMAQGADILSVQEQPYEGIDAKRTDIFNGIMARAGYVMVASQNQRDVGIWVKETLKPQSQAIDLPGLSDRPLRGCAAKVGDVLCINIHADRAAKPDNSDIVDALLVLQDHAIAYANTQTPALRISITGDMNLYQLNTHQKIRLDNAGFTTEIAKGQDGMASPTYEAFFTDKGAPLLSAAPAGPMASQAAATPTPSAAAGPALTPLLTDMLVLRPNGNESYSIPAYEFISTLSSVRNEELRTMWRSILASNTRYDPTKDLLVHAQTLPLVIQSQMLQTYLQVRTQVPNLRGIGEVECRLNEIRRLLQAIAMPSATATAQAAPRMGSLFSHQAQGPIENPTVHSSDQSDSILATLITYFCHAKNLSPGEQDRRGLFNFGVSKTSGCSYIANDEYQILIDNGHLKVLDRNDGFQEIASSTAKENVIMNMLSLACRDSEVREKEVEIRRSSASPSFAGPR